MTSRPSAAQHLRDFVLLGRVRARMAREGAAPTMARMPQLLRDR